MPLLDHFHPPVSDECNPQSVHTLWLGALTGYLNLGGHLPAGYVARAEVSVGGLEIDVAALERQRHAPPPAANGGTAVLTAPVWTRPAPTMVMPTVFLEEAEVLVYNRNGGLTLVAAIELVSAGNKDRPEHHRAFAAKCATFLHRGVGLVVVDIVTDRRANLHDEVARLMGQYPAHAFPDAPHLYAVAYEPTRREEGDQIDVWAEPLAVGQLLPTMPLPLRGYGCVPLDLESTYTEARVRNGL
jgi:hypothetical protein